jgi:hypothetical protein
MLLLPSLLLSLAPQAPLPAPEPPSGFWNGPERVTLDLDGSVLGLRFDPALSEDAVRARIAAMPGLAAGEAERAAWVPGGTVYLRTAPGTSGAAAWRLGAALRGFEGVWAAGPRLLAGDEPYFLTEELLVRWRDEAPLGAVEALTAGMTVTGALAYSENPGVVYRLPAEVDALTAATAIAESGWAEFALPDFQLLRVPLAGTNDPIYGNQWHLESTGQNGAKVDADIDVEGAWDFTRGDAAVKVAVIDTGVELGHPDLVPNLLPGIDVLDNDNNPKAEDYLFGLFQESHSTSVCGVAAGAGDNGIGTTGVAQHCGIIPIRFLSEYILNQPTLQDEVDAFVFAMQAGAAVVNNSWGPTGTAPLPAATKAAIDDLITNGRNGLGSVVFFAAGNSGSDNSGNGYASYGGVLGVTACTDQEVLASYSSYGRSVDLCAPSNGGVNGITTTDRLGGKGYSNGDYTDAFGGTSSASPAAAGVMLLVLSAAPTLTRWEATVALLGTAQKIDPAGGAYDARGFSSSYGWGRANAAAAVAAATRIDSVQLSGDAQGVVGGTVSYQLAGAPPQAAWTLYASFSRDGGLAGPHPLDIGPELIVAASGTTDAGGAASWTSQPLPAGLAGRTIHLEAFVSEGGRGYDSDPLALSVQ